MASVLGCDVEIILGKQRLKHITALSTSIWALPGAVTSLSAQISLELGPTQQSLLSWLLALPGMPRDRTQQILGYLSSTFTS